MNLAYPFRIANDGLAATATDAEHIEQMIEQLLFTNPGERVNRPDFGAPIAQYAFRGAGDETAAALQFMLQGAIQQWLGDILQIQAIQVDANDSSLVVTLSYIIRATQQPRVSQFTSL